MGYMYQMDTDESYDHHTILLLNKYLVRRKYEENNYLLYFKGQYNPKINISTLIFSLFYNFLNMSLVTFCKYISNIILDK